MTLRIKLIVALSALAAVATMFIGAASYASTRHELTESIDQSLDAAARNLIEVRLVGGDDGVGRPGAIEDLLRGRGRRGFEGVLVQLLDSSGQVISGTADLPVSDIDLRIASEGGRDHYRDITLDGESYRMLTLPMDERPALGGNAPAVGALQVARSTEANQRALSAVLRRTLMLVGLVIAAAALIGWILGRQLTKRLTALSTVAGEVAATGRLDIAIPATGSDEAGQVGRAMQGMLGALARSRDQQQRLVQDAGHELRTPLTSLRTNVSVLARFDELPAASRQQLIDDLDSETRELTALVNELVELATDRREDEAPVPTNVGALAERVAERARRRTGRDVVVVHRGETVSCRPQAIERAITNLVDNATKFAPTGPIEVAVMAPARPIGAADDASARPVSLPAAPPAALEVAVRDHGPGIDPTEAARLFERFHRSDAARAMPGSGLGLSIVAAVAAMHGGSVFARNADPGPGAVIGFTLLAD